MILSSAIKWVLPIISFFDYFHFFSGAFHCDNSCTALVVDLPFVFVGDHGGHVIVLRLIEQAAQLVTKLSAHTSEFQCLFMLQSSYKQYSA